MKREGMRLSSLAVLLGCVSGAGLLSATVAQAIPNLARQYGVECSTCHSIVPRLNDFGMDFRRAGFRQSDEIGETRDFEASHADSGFGWGNYLSTRLQANLSSASRDNATTTGGYGPGGDDYSTTQLGFKEFTIYPLTGGWGKNWASMSEISGTTDELEVENAYVRYVTGAEDKYWEIRAGIFHPFEGYGASDRPIGLARPLIQTTPAINANGEINGFHPWGFDQTGIEIGFTYVDTSVSFALFNGLIENAEDPAQGGKLKKAAGSPTENDKDFQVFANQFLGDSGAALAGYYYHGSISLGEGDLHGNTFNRYAAYATVSARQFQFLAGVGGGDDKDDITDRTANSIGWFAEIDDYVTDQFGIGARYGQFDPSDEISGNDIKSFAAFANYSMFNGLQFIAEYRNKQTEHGGSPTQTENSFNLRGIFIW